MANFIDINSDVGERPEALLDGREEELLAQISSANIACGVHAGDLLTMESVVRLCSKHHVNIGAHPSYPDRANFGRTEMNLPSDEIGACVHGQVKTLLDLAESLHCSVRHVKPHGALYNVAVKDPRVAKAVAVGIEKASKRLILLGLAGSSMLEVWRAAGFTVAAEAFADRRYEPDGSLRSRKLPGAVISDASEAVEQVLGILKRGVVVTADGSGLNVEAQTICLHSDTPNAATIARALREALPREGIEIRPL
jgi:UPF0271 protein